MKRWVCVWIGEQGDPSKNIRIYGCAYEYIDVHDRILLVGEAGPIDANGNDQKC